MQCDGSHGCAVQWQAWPCGRMLTFVAMAELDLLLRQRVVNLGGLDALAVLLALF